MRGGREEGDKSGAGEGEGASRRSILDKFLMTHIRHKIKTRKKSDGLFVIWLNIPQGNNFRKLKLKDQVIVWTLSRQRTQKVFTIF